MVACPRSVADMTETSRIARSHLRVEMAIGMESVCVRVGPLLLHVSHPGLWEPAVTVPCLYLREAAPWRHSTYGSH